MSSNIRLDLAPILSCIDWHSGTSFSFRDEKFTCPSQAEAETKLSDILYERCYIRRIDQSPPPVNSNGEYHDLLTEDLLTELRAANIARSRWQTGWQIHTVHNSGWISAERDGLERSFAPGEFVTKEGPGMPLRRGGTAEVYFAVESLYMQPGFYFAFGETIGEESDDACLVRFYWHLEPVGAPLLLRSVSTLLNRFKVPYRFKCLVHPAAYIRADAAVVFVPRRWYQIAARLLGDAHRMVASHIRWDVPLFTKPLAAGLGFAEDPGNGQSFGMHRCGVLARAICGAAVTQGSISIAEVERRLSAQGVSPWYPYLNAASVDIYEFAA